MKKVPYNRTRAAAFYRDHYLHNQTGGSLNYFAGINEQRGSGLLGSLFRASIPLVKKGLKAILPEAVHFGKNVIQDVVLDKQKIRQSLKKRGLQSLGKVGEKAIKRVKSDIFTK